ncbi:CvfB family protein [Novisyntrophococcus fermenticellae]|uniref:CvfB family protein n=1 Tax=Novisyntrophococcus fermenticellae TaxID=2068655 RepID=UPI001E4B1A6F|nr:S1-like domain-containing RNA-binding protein [Novisyntrophococcus fermenticellae]
MLEIGRKQLLVIVKKVDFGVYLGEQVNASMDERVLLPKKQVPEGAGDGDELEVFLYRDSSDRLIATTNEPKLQLGEVKELTVAAVGKIGAFLDWGLEKDLFLPFKEQTRKVEPGDSCLVALYVDKSGRLCATMKVYHYLKTGSPYVIGDEVEGTIYEISANFGAFVAVDGQYSGLIPKKEAQAGYKAGQRLKLRVTEVKEDGKLTLSARQKAYAQIEEDAENVLQVIKEFANALPFDDKASPEVIQREFGLSKGAFKRAVGHLLKEKQIEIRDGKIYRR